MAYCYHCMTKINDPSAVFCPECGNKYNEHFSQSIELPAGCVIGEGRYLVGKSIGAGGFGITYVGCDLNIDKKVLIKETFYLGLFSRNSFDTSVPNPYAVSFPGDLSIDTILRKTRKECETLVKTEGLDNIVKVYDFFSENNTAYIITEFIEGVTLGDRVSKGGAYSWNDLYQKLRPLMQSLAELHDMGILHRDIKPDNIMIKSTKRSGDKFYLIDFGLSRTNTKQTVATVGYAFTPGYAPFEQRTFSSNEGTYVDVYSLAATIYFAVTGENPIQSIDGIIDEDFPKLKYFTSDYGVPQNVVQTLYAALAFDYRSRIQTVTEMLKGFDSPSGADLDYGGTPSGGYQQTSGQSGYSSTPSMGYQQTGGQSGYSGIPSGGYQQTGGQSGYNSTPSMGYQQTSGQSGYNSTPSMGYQQTSGQSGYSSTPSMGYQQTSGQSGYSSTPSMGYQQMNGQPGFGNSPAANNNSMGGSMPQMSFNQPGGGVPISGSSFISGDKGKKSPAKYVGIGVVAVGLITGIVVYQSANGIGVGSSMYDDTSSYSSTSSYDSTSSSSSFNYFGTESRYSDYGESMSSDDGTSEYVHMKEETAIEAIESDGRDVGYVYYLFGDLYAKGIVCGETINDDNTVDLYISNGEETRTVTQMKTTSSDIKYGGVSMTMPNVFYRSMYNYQSGSEWYHINDEVDDNYDYIYLTEYDSSMASLTESDVNEYLTTEGNAFSGSSKCSNFKKYNVDGYTVISYSFTAKDSDGNLFVETDYYVNFSTYSVGIMTVDYSGDYTSYMQSLGESIRIK